MKYFLILLAIGLAVAPLLHFVPGKHQRRQARLREQAALAGLFVEFRSLPEGERRTPGRLARPRGNIIYYGKRLPPPRGKQRRSGAWRRDPQGWLSLRGTASLPDSLAGLDVDILAASLDDNSCGIYWQEAGEDSDVGAISVALEAWAAQLSG